MPGEHQTFRPSRPIPTFAIFNLSSCRLNIEKIDFSIVIKFFCDVINIEVRYFQITFKFDIFRFFLSPKLQHLKTSFFQQKIEKIIRKK